VEGGGGDISTTDLQRRNAKGKLETIRVVSEPLSGANQARLAEKDMSIEKRANNRQALEDAYNSKGGYLLRLTILEEAYTSLRNQLTTKERQIADTKAAIEEWERVIREYED
jgi:hypothetical protein